MKANGIGWLALLTLSAALPAQALPVAQSFDTVRYVEATLPGPEAEAAADAPALMQMVQVTQATQATQWVQWVQMARAWAAAPGPADELMLAADARPLAIGALSHPLHAGTGRWGRTELPGGLAPFIDRRVALLSRP